MIRNFLKMTLASVTLPIDLVKDVITMGGALNNQDQPYTVKKLNKLYRIHKSISSELPNNLFTIAGLIVVEALYIYAIIAIIRS